MFNVIKDNLLLWLILFLLVVSPSFLFGAIGVIVCIVLFFIVALCGAGIYLRWKLSKAQKEDGYQQQNNYQQRDSRKSGDPRVKIVITDEEASATDKKVSNDVGDYVEFEEIKK